jgi:hypothetical protein
MAWTPLTSAGLQTRLSQDEFNALLDECPTPDEKITSILTQVALYAPKGLLGHLYWWAVWPMHGIVFPSMAKTHAVQSK